MEILNKEPISLVEVKEILKNIKKERDLNYLESKLEQYFAKIKPISYKDAKQLEKELEELGLEKYHIIKIIEILPRTKDDLRAIFYSNAILEDSKADKILEIIKKYI